MSRVFITQQPRANRKGWTPNLTPAEKFGALHFIFSGSERPSTDPEGAVFTAQAALEDFDPKKDYLLWPNSGDPAAVLTAVAVIARKHNVSSIRFLNWERKYHRGQRSKTEGFYTPISIPLPRIEEQ